MVKFILGFFVIMGTLMFFYGLFQLFFGTAGLMFISKDKRFKTGYKDNNTGDTSTSTGWEGIKNIVSSVIFLGILVWIDNYFEIGLLD